MTVRPVDYAIWFVVLSVMGMLNSVAIYFINVLVYSKRSLNNL